MNPAAQQEPLRQQYLASMGVACWLPVRELPGAAPSPPWQWSDLEPEAAGFKPGTAAAEPVPADRSAADPRAPAVPSPPQSRQPAASADARQATANIRKLLGTEPGPSPTPAVAAPVIQPAPVVTDERVQTSEPRRPVEPQAVPRFRLALVRYQDVVVVDELPLQSLQGFTPAHQQLLGAILKAVGLGQGEPQVQVFAWPLVSSPHVDQSEAVAREGIKAQLWRLQQGATLPQLLLGSESARFVLDSGAQVDLGGFTEQGPVWCLHSHSLSELLRIPGRKRELWQHLQPLRKLSVDG